MTAPIYTPKARSDLRAILRNSGRMFGRMQARRYAAQIAEAGRDLGSGLRKGRPFDELHPGHLRLKAGSHYLIYQMDADGRIRVLRLLHVRMNIVDHL